MSKNQSQQPEFDDDDIPSNPSRSEDIQSVTDERLRQAARGISRRGLMSGFLGSLGLGAAGMLSTGTGAWAAATADQRGRVSSLTFEELPHGYDADLHVAPGYQASTLIGWGDAVTRNAPAHDLNAQTATAQSSQFGYNNDFIAYLPLPLGSKNSDHGLLCVNHEYTNPWLMFPGMKRKGYLAQMDQDQVAVEMAAHGHSVLEIKKDDQGDWQVVLGDFNRRINALDTEILLSGPVAGHARVRTSADPVGTRVLGTLNNCAGGTTPWGTVLICEENFHGYFGGDLADHPELRNYSRYGIKSDSRYHWYQVDDRFDVAAEPNEANRFGWVIEFDPYNPEAKPVKRTALGRFKHEGATTVLAKDGRVVLYSGDDQRFEYVYKFVSRDAYEPDNRAANQNLLDNGTLYAAQYKADGAMRWLPLVFGHGPLTEENGFFSQADVLIETRRAADLLGATKMDRPEDVEANPRTGAVYVLMTKNKRREPGNINTANPRYYNANGHIIEMWPVGGDHTATEGRWEMFIRAGDPSNPYHAAYYHPEVSEHGWFACPDNCAFDTQGRLWIATDGAPSASKRLGERRFADGLWACDTDGEGRALTRHFLRGPVGSETCGPCFTPDGKTLFVAIQHPGEKSASFDEVDTRWPDKNPEKPPRPAVVAIRKHNGGLIGS